MSKIKDKALKELGEEKADIFEAHLMVLEDPELISSTLNKVEGEKFNAEYSFKEVTSGFIDLFESMDNEYMRERASDMWISLVLEPTI